MVAPRASICSDIWNASSLVGVRMQAKSYQRIENLLGQKLPEYQAEEEEVLLLGERVGDALRLAKVEMREMDDKKGKGRKRRNGDEQDMEGGIGISDRIGNKSKRGPGGKNFQQKKRRK